MNNLHDATLLTFHFEWGSALLQIYLRTASSPEIIQVLEVEQVREFICPRQFSWGPSSSIDKAAIKETNNRPMLLIEMQSGDMIMVQAGAIRRKAPDVDLAI